MSETFYKALTSQNGVPKNVKGSSGQAGTKSLNPVKVREIKALARQFTNTRGAELAGVSITTFKKYKNYNTGAGEVQTNFDDEDGRR